MLVTYLNITDIFINRAQGELMERYICIHAHFYQPPRENAWLEAVELQDSAYPYHDWNERVTAECYAPNSASRILDGDGRILQIVNNYSKISFNFGPTLLSWMEQKSPAVYQAILEADRASQRLFSGHGSAVAQAYNHMILPLASRQDKYTQIFGGSGILRAASVGIPRECGCRKPRLICRRWKCWRNWESSSRFFLPIRPGG